MLAHAEKKVFLCDSEKFNRYSGYKQCSLKEIDYLITETEKLEKLRTIAGYEDCILL